MSDKHACSPWHPGEQEMQERAGSRQQMAATGPRVIRDHMPEQHREFFRQLPFLAMAALDGAGRPWAGIIEGLPGFAVSPDERALRLNSLPSPADPLRDCLRPGAAVALLGIELHTRRRNRMNGKLAELDESGMTVAVEQSFGNCPKYIQLREFQFAREPGPRILGSVEWMDELDEDARAQISAADTFFVASAAPAGPASWQADISHRGGKPGFVKVAGDTLTIPDFAGNGYFNTLGNLLLHPPAGLLFIDFSSGDTLQLAGRAEVLDLDAASVFAGAERLWTFRVERVVRRRNASALRWTLREYSPYALATGAWPNAAPARQWLPLRVSRVEDESETVRSIYLEPADGSVPPDFLPGQHLSLKVAGVDGARMRNYTLSQTGSYRISVKRQGKVSARLHQLAPGDIVEALPPRGDFTLARLDRPIALLAGGIGITPMLAFLHQLTEHPDAMPPTLLAYATRTVAERAFDAELEALQAKAAGKLRVVTAASQPETARRLGIDYQHAGHVDIALLRRQGMHLDGDVYLCGPAAFMQSLYEQLIAAGVEDSRIHAEAFGPAGLQRAGHQAPALPAPADGAVPVRFAASAMDAEWQPGQSLLELAESCGLNPDFSCRGGSCGSCRAALLSGQATYLQAPEYAAQAGEILLCCAYPAAGADKLEINL
ncbi:pyridoxamine 5'-phosphate oxidase family protein [Chromobacterium sp. IIBBL 290-4]|uniref:2Fe-2S iron-sulfur cluster-binding protein n=1 Tax=Chromobacterium sp. IIBBL 290-4 TaxID=2953890 RepID=UPI0020B8156B|nr:pyridoxamine 5'-phosphate oxidase family protein [Chromobacterium sp. IIBBL 290-4]UTH72931.1 pyridoxamine 5'-phosphate oxidase family protein [Chromobacterium sp. IIBBL 290-4]